MKKTYTVKALTLSLTDQLTHTEDKLGSVYKCVDQNGEAKLLHITNVSFEDVMLSKFYLMETNFNVLLEYLLV